MDEARLTSLRTYYQSLTDDALLEEAELGRDAFGSEAWTIISQEIDQRDLKHNRSHRHHRDLSSNAAVAEASKHQSSLAERLAARIDALPPSIKPAAFGAMIVVIFALARGAWLILPVVVIYVLATRPDPWSSLMTGAGIAVLAMLGGALSGFAYSLVGRHVRAAIRGGYYLTGIVTVAPYMLVLVYIVRLSDGLSLWHRPRGSELAISGFMTLLFGLVLGRAWFGPDEKAEHSERAT